MNAVEFAPVREARPPVAFGVMQGFLLVREHLDQLCALAINLEKELAQSCNFGADMDDHAPLTAWRLSQILEEMVGSTQTLSAVQSFLQITDEDVDDALRMDSRGRSGASSRGLEEKGTTAAGGERSARLDGDVLSVQHAPALFRSEAAQDGASAFKALMTRMDQVAGETATRFLADPDRGGIDCRDFLHILQVLEGSILGLGSATRTYRRGFLMAMAEFLCIVGDGAVPGDDWVPLNEALPAMDLAKKVVDEGLTYIDPPPAAPDFEAERAGTDEQETDEERARVPEDLLTSPWGEKHDAFVQTNLCHAEAVLAVAIQSLLNAPEPPAFNQFADVLGCCRDLVASVTRLMSEVKAGDAPFFNDLVRVVSLLDTLEPMVAQDFELFKNEGLIAFYLQAALDLLEKAIEAVA